MPSDARSSHRSEHVTSPASRFVRAAGEVFLLGAVALSPWAYGSVDARPEFYLSLLVAGVAVLWAAHAVLTDRLTVRPDVVTLALAGLVAWTAFQLVPLPEGVVAVVAPDRAAWHRTLLPAVEEVLPGEAGGAPRATAIPLSVNPAATRALLARLLGLLVAYAAARNWLADRESLSRLQWLLTGLGFVVAFFAVWQAATVPPNTGFWGAALPATPYGPFLNRNHYSDFAALCAGGGLGLVLAKPDNGLWFTGKRMGLALVTVFVLLTIPPSLSRGGMMAVAAAGVSTWVLSRVGQDDVAGGWGRLALAAAVGLALVSTVTLGITAVEDRLATLLDGREVATSGRLPMWRRVLGLVPGAPVVGTGGGTFEAVEPLTRTEPELARINFEFAHNEYLEALVEGGVVRLALTLLLAGGVLWAVGRGAAERRDRSVGGPLLGLWFGLAVVAFHAAGEFALHMPAVALAAAVVAGYAVAAAQDGEFMPHRVRVRRSSRRRSRRTEEVPAPSAESAPPADAPAAEPARSDWKWTGRGPAAWAAGLAVAAAALLVAVDARTRARAAAYEAAADAVERGLLPGGDDPVARRVVYADARAAVRPDDPNGRLLAAEAHLQAAYARTVAVNAAVLGGPGGWAARVERVDDGPDLRAAVAHLRAARRVEPVNGRVHARLGLLAGHFQGEPAAVHFDRAKRTLPADPAVWFAAGREAFTRGDRAAALADWRRSLELRGGRLADILVSVRGLSVDQLRTNLLPAEPAVSLAAADALYPDRQRQAEQRRPFLVAAVTQAKEKPKATGPDWMAAALAADELGRTDQAGDCWKAAVANAPRSLAVRDGYARWLEREDRWQEAIDQLRHMQKLRNVESIQDRIEACYHGLKLKQALGE